MVQKKKTLRYVSFSNESYSQNNETSFGWASTLSNRVKVKKQTDVN